MFTALQTPFDKICRPNRKGAIHTVYFYDAKPERSLDGVEKFKPAHPKLEDMTLRDFPVEGGKALVYSYDVSDKQFAIAVLKPDSLKPDSGKPTAAILVNELGFTNHELHKDLSVPLFLSVAGREERLQLTGSEEVFQLVKNAEHLDAHGHPYLDCYKEVTGKLLAARTPRDMQAATSAKSIPAQFFLGERWAAKCVPDMFLSLLTVAANSESFFGKYFAVAELLKSHGVDLETGARVYECRSDDDTVWGVGAKSQALLKDLVARYEAKEAQCPVAFVDALVAEKKATSNFGQAATPFLAAVGTVKDYEEFQRKSELYTIRFELKEEEEGELEEASPKRKLSDVDEEPLERTHTEARSFSRSVS